MDTTARGFTLLELLVTIAIGVLVIGWAVPSFFHLVRDARRTASVNDFVTAVHFARSEAIKRARRIVLCRSGDGQRCERGEETGWEAGWFVFVNLDADDPPQVDEDEPILLLRGAETHATVRGNRQAFTFRPFGKRATNGTLTFCDERGPDHARAIVVSPTGRPRTAATDAAGNALVCDGH